MAPYPSHTTYRSEALADIDEWVSADRHLDLLDVLFSEFAGKGDWPAIDGLQRTLVRKGWTIDLEWECRNAPPGLVRDLGDGRFGLTIRALSYVPAAKGYATAFVWLLQLGVRAFLDDRDQLDSDQLANIPASWAGGLTRVARLARMEQPMQTLSVREDGSWRWPLDPYLVLNFKDITTVEAYLDAQARFSWPIDAPVPPVEPDERDRWRQNFLTTWLEWGRPAQSLAQLIATPSKNGNVAPRVEIGLADACSALGMSVFFGGAALAQEGLDFVAFDAESGCAIACSVTIGNQIGKKLNSLVPRINRLREVLASAWPVSAFILTTDARADCPTAQIDDAHKDGISVLTKEDLACLAASPPNLEAFGRALRSGAMS